MVPGRWKRTLLPGPLSKSPHTFFYLPGGEVPAYFGQFVFRRRRAAYA
jgi:hypothetical protein